MCYKIKMNKGFTMIELIMVIVILGILAVVAIPRFTSLAPSANTAAEQGVVGGVRAGISTYHAAQNPPAYPATLDSAADGACTTANACFTTVLSQGGVTSGWSKAGLVYTGPAAGTYTYTPGGANPGSFQ